MRTCLPVFIHHGPYGPVMTRGRPCCMCVTIVAICHAALQRRKRVVPAKTNTSFAARACCVQAVLANCPRPASWFLSAYIRVIPPCRGCGRSDGAVFLPACTRVIHRGEASFLPVCTRVIPRRTNYISLSGNDRTPEGLVCFCQTPDDTPITHSILSSSDLRTQGIRGPSGPHLFSHA